MIKVAGVRFRGSGKIYWFDPGQFEIRPGVHVIVETARGPEYGVISGPVRELPDDKVTHPLRSIIRVADEEDEERIATNRCREKEAYALCKEKIRKHELEMKLIDAEYAFDNSKILFYFTADGRVDFRELVKDLAGVFHTRIELRQIGVRDETKILGGIGICGRPLCCHTYLTDFVPVSIKMAKEQNLSLNPTKISGVCGRLMCCLKNEEETYEYLNSKLPAIGDTVVTPTGAEGEVAQVSVLRQKVKVIIMDGDEKEAHEYSVEELTFEPRKGKGKKDGRRDKSRDHGKEGAKARRESGKDPGKDPVKGSGSSSGKDRDKTFGKEPGRSAEKQGEKQDGKDPAREGRREGDRESRRDYDREKRREDDREPRRDNDREKRREDAGYRARRDDFGTEPREGGRPVSERKSAPAASGQRGSQAENAGEKDPENAVPRSRKNRHRRGGKSPREEHGDGSGQQQGGAKQG